MKKALSVAKYLIALAAAEDEPDPLTHLRLQKLLYYVQGCSLALRKKPMFEERIEAWAHGPVVASLYPFFANYKNASIHQEDFPYEGGLNKTEKELIQCVWNIYKKYSATSLREMTHNEEPWIKARGQKKPADKCSTEITPASMKKYFNTLIQ